MENACPKVQRTEFSQMKMTRTAWVPLLVFASSKCAMALRELPIQRKTQRRQKFQRQVAKQNREDGGSGRKLGVSEGLRGGDRWLSPSSASVVIDSCREVAYSCQIEVCFPLFFNYNVLVRLQQFQGGGGDSCVPFFLY